MPISAAERANLEQELAASVVSAAPDVRQALTLLMPSQIEKFLLSRITPGESNGLLDLLILHGGGVIAITITKTGLQSQLLPFRSVEAIEFSVEEKSVDIRVRHGATRVWRQSMPRAPGVVELSHAFVQAVVQRIG